MLNKKLATGYNDVRTCRPDLAEQWSYKNLQGPDNVLISSKVKVWWKCLESGYEWEESPSRRNLQSSTQSPAVLGRVAVYGFNDLASAVPDIVHSWSSSNPFSPKEVVAKSNTKIRLIDVRTGAEWDDTAKKVNNRGCVLPHKLVKGLNDLKTCRPDLASQLDPSLDPSDFTVNSNEKVTWICPETGEKWDAIISNRIRTGVRSPFQTNRRIQKGVTDLQTLRPDIAFQMVTPFDPRKMSLKSNVKARWRCPVYGILWDELVSARTSRATSDSPFVRGVRSVPGVTDLLTIHPELKSIWNFPKNTVDPSSLLPRSHLKVWWVCDKGHEWQARVADVSRVDGKATTCPDCAASDAASKAERNLVEYIETLGVTVNTQVRGLVQNRVSDVYIPESNTIIEFNGVYWHSDKFIEKTMHEDRFAAARCAGITLVTVWEDDWTHKREAVESRIKYYVKGHDETGQCTPTGINKLEASEFFEKYHVYADLPDDRLIYGLKYNSNIVSAVSCSVNDATLTVENFVSTVMSAKWFDTLLCHALENVCATNSIEKVQIIVNNDMPEDYVLQENGFVIDTHVPAEYTYLIRSRRVTEVDISKEIFEKLPSLKYDANLSTKELIDLNGLKKIWDSGRTIWTKSLQPGKF